MHAAKYLVRDSYCACAIRVGVSQAAKTEIERVPYTKKMLLSVVAVFLLIQSACELCRLAQSAVLQ